MCVLSMACLIKQDYKGQIKLDNCAQYMLNLDLAPNQGHGLK